MTHDHETFDRDYWENRYSAPGFTWSGNPNAVLVQEASTLTPGLALDIGSGEGGDAQWLADRGWDVTAVDISSNAIEKAKARILAADPVAARRITWMRHDLTEWLPQPRSFDLVTSHFMHLADPERGVLFRGLAEAVAPGGTLLIVGHDVAGDAEHGHLIELTFTVDDVVALLDGLEIQVAETRPRESHNGHAMKDVVVRATRKG